MTKRLVFLFLILIGSHRAFTQVPANVASGPQGNKRLIVINKADRLNLQQPDSLTRLQSAAGSVYITQEQTQFYCDSVVINSLTNVMEAYGNVRIVDRGTVIRGQFVRYLGNERKAFLNRNVSLDDGQSILTTEELTYDLGTHVGNYYNGGKVVNKQTVLTSKEATYYGDLKDIYFYQTVRLNDPKYKIYTDTLLYNTGTEIATFQALTRINTDKQTIDTRSGYYDLKKKTAYFGKRPTIIDGRTSLTANDIANDDASGLGEASGNVVYVDSANGLSLFANNVKTNQKTNTLLATQLPVARLKRDGDSLFIAADTLFTTQLLRFQQTRVVPVLPPVDYKGNQPSEHEHDHEETDSLLAGAAKKTIADTSLPNERNRILEAYYNVRVYSDSMQAAGDSLFYSANDSILRMYKNPIAWAQGSQINGDTMYLYTANQKPKRVQIFENAFALNEAGQGFTNQLKGRTMNGYFANGELYFLRTKGNAQSVYYPLDDSTRFIGVNTLTCDAIEMYFEDRKPQKLVAISNLKGKMYPMRTADHEGLRLRGANWQNNRRPKSWIELFDKPTITIEK